MVPLQRLVGDRIQLRGPVKRVLRRVVGIARRHRRRRQLQAPSLANEERVPSVLRARGVLQRRRPANPLANFVLTLKHSLIIIDDFKAYYGRDKPRKPKVLHKQTAVRE